MTEIGVVCGLIAFIVMVYLSGRKEGSKRKEMERQIADLPNFSPAVRFEQVDRAQVLLLDPQSNQFVIAKPSAHPRLYRFDELVAVDVQRNGASLEKTNRGSQVMGAAVGAALLGPVGLLVGGLTGSKRQVELVKRLSLKIFTTDLQTPVTEVIFFESSKGSKPDDALVTSCAQQLDAWHGRFRTILQGNGRATASIVQTPEVAPAGEPTPTGGFGRRRRLVVPG